MRQCQQGVIALHNHLTTLVRPAQSLSLSVWRQLHLLLSCEEYSHGTSCLHKVACSPWESHRYGMSLEAGSMSYQMHAVTRASSHQYVDEASTITQQEQAPAVHTKV